MEHTSFPQGASDQSVFETGSVIAGRYEVVSQLGAGGMGVVLRVIDRTLDNEPAALKLLYPHLVKDQVVFARFRNEVLVARQLSHPNIVRIYDFGSAGKGYYFISMEYVNGRSLKDRIYSRKLPALKFSDALRLLYEIGLGMSYAHRKNVVHRDLKPDNILLTDAGEVRVTDFGLARLIDIDKGFTQTGETVGTPCYMAPEQIRGEQVDARADIYSLGIIAYEMVVGERPFDDDNWLSLAQMHMKEPIPPFAKACDVPMWFEDFVVRSTAKDPEERFESVDEWCDELLRNNKLPHGSQVSPALFSTSVAKVLRKKRIQRRHRAAILRGALWALLVMLGVVIPSLMVRSSLALQQSSLRSITLLERTLGITLSPLRTAFGVNVVADKERFFLAVRSGDVKTAALMLAAGVDPNVTDASGNTAMHAAAMSGNEPIISALLSEGANLESKDATGMTPAMVAARNERGDLLQKLLTASSDVNARDNKGLTALMHAATAGAVGSVQDLLRRGAFANGKDDSGAPVLVHAVLGKNLAVIQTLLDAGAKINERDKLGWTPLMHAVRSGSPEVAQALVSRGADIDLRNNSGKTARDLVNSTERAAFAKALGGPAGAVVRDGVIVARPNSN